MASNRKGPTRRAARPVAVFWDIENICAKRYQNRYGLNIPFFTQKVIGAIDTYCSREGLVREVSYVAMGHRPTKLFDCYSNAGYEFIFRDTDHGGKNSADILLIKKMAHAVRQYPETKDYILITGDSDFAEPVRILQELGIDVHLFYDPQWASRELIKECHRSKTLVETMCDAGLEHEFFPAHTTGMDYYEDQDGPSPGF